MTTVQDLIDMHNKCKCLKLRACTCGECEECRKIMFEEELQQEHYRRMGYIL
jgi:hypothetical protein